MLEKVVTAFSKLYHISFIEPQINIVLYITLVFSIWNNILFPIYRKCYLMFMSRLYLKNLANKHDSFGMFFRFCWADF